MSMTMNHEHWIFSIGYPFGIGDLFSDSHCMAISRMFHLNSNWMTIFRCFDGNCFAAPGCYKWECAKCKNQRVNELKLNLFRKMRKMFRCTSETIKIDNENRNRLSYNDTLALPYRPHLKNIPSFFLICIRAKKCWWNWYDGFMFCGQFSKWCHHKFTTENKNKVIFHFKNSPTKWNSFRVVALGNELV